MQNDFQLTVGAMRRRLRSCYPHQEVVTLEGDGPVRASYAQVAERVDRLGRVLERLGVERGDRVATFAWNTSATSSSTSRCRPTAPSCTR